jgi:lipopolysaccharide/colanic/teichoic acid biosynthesis glycosyltransferase
MHKVRKWAILIIADLFIVLIAYWITYFFVSTPPRLFLLFTAVLWVIIGVIINKLNFDSYKNSRYALSSIFFIDIILSLAVFCFKKHFYSESGQDISILIAAIITVILESFIYLIYRYFFIKKIPYSFEENENNFNGNEYENVAQLCSEENVGDLAKFLSIVERKKINNPIEWKELNGMKFNSSTMFLLSTTVNDLKSELKEKLCSLLILLQKVNNVIELNKYLSECNNKLKLSGYFICCCKTSMLQKQSILKSYPPIINWLFYCISYFWHRFLPKMPLIKRIYFGITGGKNRIYPRVEMLGRLYMAGFDVHQEAYYNGDFYVVAVKVKEPFIDIKPNEGPIIKLKRVGKGGKIIGVYKFRTMYAYSEFLQPYIYKYNKLQEGGKIADDYRIDKFGKCMRKCWIDELPMILNLIKGDMKIVGVRPLSLHYFSLYSPEMQSLRTETKPGLLPPYYVDMPKGIEEIQRSEKKYLQAYFAHPLITDVKYFWMILYCIIFKRESSS